MRYQYKREPLTQEESNRLSNACETGKEKLIIWTLLDTGLRVAELANLTSSNIDWQNHRLIIYGKGGIYGKKTKRRIVPMTNRVQPLIENYFAINNELGLGARQIQRVVKTIANKAQIRKPVSPHTLRHTFSITAIQKGISTRTLQELLGHDRLTTTEIYLNLSPEEAIREFKMKW